MDVITSVYLYYGIVAVLVAAFAYYSWFVARRLHNHSAARTLRELVTLQRREDADKLGECFNIITKNKNDIGAMFYVYCRIFPDLSQIKSIMNYKMYKVINKKHKPLVLTFGILLLVGIAGLTGVGIWQSLGAELDILKLGLSAGLSIVYFGVVLGFMIPSVRIINSAWQEFKNLFFEFNRKCEDFFTTEDAKYKEFSNKVFAEIIPSEKSGHRVETLIARIEGNYMSVTPTRSSILGAKHNDVAPVMPQSTGGDSSQFNAQQVLQMVMQQNMQTAQMAQAAMQATHQQSSQMAAQAMQSTQLITQNLEKLVSQTMTHQTMMRSGGTYGGIPSDSQVAGVALSHVSPQDAQAAQKGFGTNKVTDIDKDKHTGGMEKSGVDAKKDDKGKKATDEAEEKTEERKVSKMEERLEKFFNAKSAPSGKGQTGS